MSFSDLAYIFGLLSAVLVFAAIVNLVHRRQAFRRVSSSRESSIGYRIRNNLLVGTDNDLKIELAFLGYVTAMTLLTHSVPIRSRAPVEFIPAVLALLLGFHFRQWLSKWRLRNIVSMKRLTSKSPIVIKANSTIAFVLTNILIWYLLYLNPRYAILQLVGLFVHEGVAETEKNRRVLRRRLHLFDLDAFSLDTNTADIIYRMPGPFGLRRLHGLIVRETNFRRSLALRAFRELFSNDQREFCRLLDENIDTIKSDQDLCYYFGRALYTLGDIPRAEQLLDTGVKLCNDVRCAAYLALAKVARIQDKEQVYEARAILQPYLDSGQDSPGKMFAHAYFALASALIITEEAPLESGIPQDALAHIHYAMRMNERFLAKRELGRLSYSYYRGNELILMDICGYIMFRLGEPRLAYRILDGVVTADNTYPWPYFHIALIYKKQGLTSLAHAIFKRIATNERTESVIYHLAVDELGRLGAKGEPSTNEEGVA
jgi:tetratricopeptide (TPR) repeat protein